MGRAQSANGCIPCKQRRKKCPEQRPVCEACQRLGFKCSYQDSAVQQPYSNKSVVLGVYRLQSPFYQTRQLPTATFKTVEQEAIVSRASSVLKNRFLPTYTRGNQTVDDLMQVALGFEHVADALVACFTGILITQQGLSKPLPEQLWNQASRSIQAVSLDKRDPQFFFTLAIAAMFMWAIEASAEVPSELIRTDILKAVATGFINNPSLHFNAGVKLIKAAQELSEDGKLSMPHDLCIFVLEGFMFQATVCMFVTEKELRIGYHRYRELCQLLTRLNPPGNSRIDRSPLLAGLYDLFACMYEVILLHRSSNQTEISRTRVHVLEKQVVQIQSDLQQRISEGRSTSTTDLTKMVETYRLCCVASFLNLNSLKAPSASRDSRIATGIRIGLKTLNDMKMSGGNNYPLLWSLQVLRCAISRPADIKAFNSRFSEVREYFHGLPLARTESLFRRLSQIDLWPPSAAEQQLRLFEDDETLPRGMLLFRQKGGVLAQEF